jgi:hypothetical protein
VRKRLVLTFIALFMLAAPDSAFYTDVEGTLSLP